MPIRLDIYGRPIVTTVNESPLLPGKRPADTSPANEPDAKRLETGPVDTPYMNREIIFEDTISPQIYDTKSILPTVPTPDKPTTEEPPILYITPFPTTTVEPQYPIDASLGSTSFDIMATGGSFTNLTTTTRMEDSKMDGGTDGLNVGNKETKLTIHRPVSNLENTHTHNIKTKFAITWSAPWKDYYNQPEAVFSLRLNSPYTPICDGDFVTTANTTAWVPGLHKTTASTGLTTTPTTLKPYVASVAYTEAHVARWLAYCTAMYEDYAVVKTNYKVVIINPSQLSTSECDVYKTHEAYSNADTTRIPTASQAQNAIDPLYWTELERKRLGYQQAQTSGNPIPTGPAGVTFAGTWKPNTIHHNVKNDEDYKTWSATGAVPINGVVECATFFAMPCVEKPYVATTSVFGYNMWIEMEWDVQFKDLKNAGRWINQDMTDIDIKYPDVIRGTM
jgi:hypothetical protein